MIKGKRGNLTLFFVFVIVGLIVLLIASIFAPLGAQISAQFYAAGEDILNATANGAVADIDNANIRDQINATLQSGMDTTQENVELYTAIYKYGGWIAIFLIAIIIFLFSRRLVEFGYGGGII